MKPRFEPDLEPTGNRPTPRLIDPEAYDASEQRFAASLEPMLADHGFVVDEEPAGSGPPENGELAQPPSATTPRNQGFLAEKNASGRASCNHQEAASSDATGCVSASLPPVADPDSWREEVAAKVNHYRARKRPRAPRYPSLQLKFEIADSEAAPAASHCAHARKPPQVRALPSTPDELGTEEKKVVSARQDCPEAQPEPLFVQETSPASAAAGKILEFPVSSAPPPVVIDELAEPVFDRPRILEAPEVVPPPPALGGILIEPVEEPQTEKRQGFELPLIAAPFIRRILAGGIDALIVVSAFALFAYTFFRITALLPPLRQAVGLSAGLIAVFWAGYEYLLLVHAGTTPGLKLARLRLSRFDGTEAPRKLRRWRVLASLLSGLSLGLGYAWCFLDEDQLCWHDRITHTYMAPKAPK